MKMINITIERSYKKDVIFFICIYLVAFYLGRFVDEMLVLELFLVVSVIGEILIEKYTKKTRQLTAQFQGDRVVLSINGKEKSLLYKNIIEVQKIMKITRYTTEKGRYRVKVKTKGRSYSFYTPSEDYEMHLNFEETELASLYRTFGEYGVKCC